MVQIKLAVYSVLTYNLHQTHEDKKWGNPLSWPMSPDILNTAGIPRPEGGAVVLA